MNGKAGAIFDIDGTLYKGYFIIDLANFLAEKGKFSKTALARTNEALAKYKAGEISYAQATKQIVGNYAEGVKGQNALKVLALAKELVEKNKGKFFPNAKELVARRKKEGVVAAVSLSPIESIGPLREIFGFDYVYGVWLKSRNGKYTGEYSSQNLQNFKQNAVGTIIKMFKLDPKRTRYFGDTLTDLKVTQSIRIRTTGKRAARTKIGFKALNPDAELRAALRKQKRIKRR